MFRKMTLSSRLIGAFVVVLLLLVSAMGVYQYSSSYTLSSFEKLLKLEVAVADHAAICESYMLQCRRNEKDFLIRKDKKYVDRLESIYSRLLREV